MGARRVTAPRLLAGALLAAVLAPGPALGAGGVTLSINGQPGPRLASQTLTAHVDVPLGTQTTTRYADGHESPDGRGGTSAAELLVLAGLDPEHVDGLSIARPNTSGTVDLDNDDITKGFTGDPLPGGPFFATFDSQQNASGEVHFFRPMRSRDDVNRTDILDPPINREIAAAAKTDGPTLTISAMADPGQTEKARPITFSATGAGDGATYTWNFGDGSASQTGTGVSHAFAQDGSFDAVVTAARPDGGSGAASARVQVGSAPAAGKAPSGGGTAKPTAPSSGPRKGAKTPASGGADDKPGRTKQQPNTTVPDTPASPSPPSIAPSPGAAPATSGTGRASQQPDAKAKRSTPVPGGTLENVSGVLLASAGAGIDPATRDAIERASAQAGRAPKARASVPPGHPFGWWLMAGAGVLGLLGLGAGREAGVPLAGKLRFR